MDLDPEVLLANWKKLNNIISTIDDEEFCKLLLKMELKGRRRGMFVFRIHSRMNKLRANRERLAFLRICGKDAACKIKAYPEMRRSLGIS